MFDDTDDENIGNKLDSVPKGLRAGIPSIKIRKRGGKIVIQNFGKIVRDMKREKSHLKRFISKSLGTKTKISGDQLEVHSSVLKHKIEEVFEDYLEKYITCPDCGKPDTLLDKKGKHRFTLQCLACGTETKVS